MISNLLLPPHDLRSSGHFLPAFGHPNSVDSPQNNLYLPLPQHFANFQPQQPLPTGFPQGPHSEVQIIAQNRVHSPPMDLILPLPQNFDQISLQPLNLNKPGTALLADHQSTEVNSFSGQANLQSNLHPPHEAAQLLTPFPESRQETKRENKVLEPQFSNFLAPMGNSQTPNQNVFLPLPELTGKDAPLVFHSRFTEDTHPGFPGGALCPIPVQMGPTGSENKPNFVDTPEGTYMREMTKERKKHLEMRKSWQNTARNVRLAWNEQLKTRQLAPWNHTDVQSHPHSSNLSSSHIAPHPEVGYPLLQSHSPQLISQPSPMSVHGLSGGAQGKFGLTAEDREVITRRLFRRYVSSGNGQLGFDELMFVCSTLKTQFQSIDMNPDRIHLLMNKFDSNSDGYLTRDEFRNLIEFVLN